MLVGLKQTHKVSKGDDSMDGWMDALTLVRNLRFISAIIYIKNTHRSLHNETKLRLRH